MKQIRKMAVLGLLCMSLQVGGMSVMANNIQELTNKEVQTVAVDKQADVKDLNSISAFPVGEFNKDYAKYFSGKSWLAPLNNEEVGIHNVTFEPTSRNDWHVHHGAGQILVVVGGKGWYQEAGKPAQALATGDVVYIAPEIKHWHGATADSYFSHLAMTVHKEGVSVTWMEPVTDAEYKDLKWEHK